MKRYTYTAFAFLGLIFSIFLFVQAKEASDKITSDAYQIKAIKIPSYLSFASERVPLEKEDIKERVDREFLVNTYWQSNALLLIKRSHKYFPVIEPILKKNGIPDDFKYLAVIESGLQNVSSPAGAKGFWQLMKGTARENHLEVNANVDERYNLEKATEAACNYLLKQKERFGSWTLTAASYNVGPNGLNRRMKAQMVDDYYDLLLPDETSRYLPRILAVKAILENPESYGFIFEQDDLYQLPELKKIEVDTVIHNLASFSKQLDLNYKELKLYNPWLRENKLNNATRKNYEILVPVSQP
ncbi:MAG: lytic transglycosylase domain-containing protein [Flavobacteriaceae bacterium]